MANQNIGSISRVALLKALPEEIDIRKSGREGCKFPLYLSTPWGPWHMNTKAAQDLLLEHGQIHGAPPAAVSEDEPDKGEPEPVTAPAPAAKPEKPLPKEEIRESWEAWGL